MKIGIDLDEVLADFLSSLIKFHNDKYGTSYSRDQFHSYRVYEIWGGTLDKAISEIHEFYNTEYFDNIAPIPGSLENIEILSKNHELVIITSRQNDISEKTNNWINNHFQNKFSEVFFADHNAWIGKRAYKSEICKKHGMDFMIEDYLEFAAECAKSVKKVLLLDSPWNKMESLPDNILRVYSWNEITNKLLKEN